MLKIDNELKSLIPALSSEEFEQLEKNILEEGIRDPIIVWGDTIIDGHNRYDIACKHRISYNTIEKVFDNKEAVTKWMIINQFGRRNLSAYDRSLLALKLEEILKSKLGRPDKSSQKSENFISKDKYKEMGKIAGVSHDTISKVKNIDSKAPEEIKQKIKSGEISINKVYNDIKQQEKREEIKKTIQEKPKQESKSIDINTTDNKYRIIYADPPWSYGNNMPEYFSEQADHYTLMSLKQICDMPVKRIADNNAVLFLWVTSPVLEESFEVIKAWGFKYKSSFIWDKIKHNMGHYNSVRHELLLICTRGSCQPDVQKLFDSVQSIERTKHSEKPAEFREIIDTIYPIGERIELFSRKIIKGWDSYGNEI